MDTSRKIFTRSVQAGATAPIRCMSIRCMLQPAVRAVAVIALITLVTSIALLTPTDARAVKSDSLIAAASAANKKIKSMQTELDKRLKAYKQATDELAQTRKLITKNEKRIKVLDESIDLRQDHLNDRADYMYRTGGVGYLELLLTSKDLSDLTDRVSMLTYVVESDSELISKLQAEEREREQARADLQSMETKQEQVAAARKQQVSDTRTALGEAQAYADQLDDAVSAALEAERAAANKQRAAQQRKADTSNPDQQTIYVGTGVTFEGLATWYGVGTGTASGERFNPNALTCAHKTLPFGTLVRVTYKGKSVVVRVNDRGPYGKGRVIDLTVRAAEIIGMKSAGVGKVKCEIVEKQ
ncbi:MAG: septal ring lytic transglycosylase RlpA family protein [Actinomycetes bacterium]|jgi:rare lipoprotein A|nr:septal ring lytic transglycosylase RlpA family protein [Actinomycetes bacterium]